MLMELIFSEAGKLLAAVAAGALIGLERELADKPAGFRTNIMICLGAALFTLLSVRMADGDAGVDRTRIAAQIVTGVGFLGAGAIIQLGGNIIGLTTAATIWAVASVGMAFGAGEFAIGVLGTVLASGVLFGLSLAETHIDRWRSVALFHIELDLVEDARGMIERLVHEAGARCKSCSLSKSRDSVSGQLMVAGPITRLDAVERALWREKSVRAIRRS